MTDQVITTIEEATAAIEAGYNVNPEAYKAARAFRHKWNFHNNEAYRRQTRRLYDSLVKGTGIVPANYPTMSVEAV